MSKNCPWCGSDNPGHDWEICIRDKRRIDRNLVRHMSDQLKYDTSKILSRLDCEALCCTALCYLEPQKTPDVGAVLRCLVCAYDKPWGLFDESTGVAVCVDCKNAPGQLKGLKEPSLCCMVYAEAQLKEQKALTAERDALKAEVDARKLFEDQNSLLHKKDIEDRDLWKSRAEKAREALNVVGPYDSLNCTHKPEDCCTCVYEANVLWFYFMKLRNEALSAFPANTRVP